MLTTIGLNTLNRTFKSFRVLSDQADTMVWREWMSVLDMLILQTVGSIIQVTSLDHKFGSKHVVHLHFIDFFPIEVGYQWHTLELIWQIGPSLSEREKAKHGDETDPYGVMNGPFSEMSWKLAEMSTKMHLFWFWSVSISDACLSGCNEHVQLGILHKDCLATRSSGLLLMVFVVVAVVVVLCCLLLLFFEDAFLGLSIP